jgi:hypothetical protein
VITALPKISMLASQFGSHREDVPSDEEPGSVHHLQLVSMINISASPAEVIFCRFAILLLLAFTGTNGATPDLA